MEKKAEFVNSDMFTKWLTRDAAELARVERLLDDLEEPENKFPTGARKDYCEGCDFVRIMSDDGTGYCQVHGDINGGPAGGYDDD